MSFDPLKHQTRFQDVVKTLYSVIITLL